MRFIFSSHIIYLSSSGFCCLFTPIPSSAPYLARFECHFTPRHNAFPLPKRCRVPPVLFPSRLVRSSRGFCPFKHFSCSSFRSAVRLLMAAIWLITFTDQMCIIASQSSQVPSMYTPQRNFRGWKVCLLLITSHRPCRLCVAFYHKSPRRFLVHLLTKVSRYESARTFGRENLVLRTFLSRTASPWDPVSQSPMRRAIVKVKCDTMITMTPPTITTRLPISPASP